MPQNDSETTLILKRGQLKAQLTRFQNFLNAFDEETTSLSEVETRLARVNDILDKYEEIQYELELLQGDIQNDERQSFENTFHKICAVAKDLLQNKTQNDNNTQVNALSSSMTVNTQTTGIQNQIKLPQIQLPDFYGHYDQWVTFHDIFTNIVHNNSQLSKIQKFYYLQSCLKGEAAQIIHSLNISNDNYEIAWSLLKERYENKKIIINSHIKAIYDLSPIRNESCLHLRKLLDSFNRNFRALTALGQPTDKWDTPIIFTLTSKLDITSKKEWEQYISKDPIETITITKLTEFIAQRCQLLETIENKNKFVKTNLNTRDDKSYSHIATQSFTCVFCKQNHLNYNCEKFSKMPVTQRLTEVKKNKLCTNCLRPNHFSYECRTGTCRQCNKKHHTLLHNPEYRQSNTNSETKSNETQASSEQAETATALACTTTSAAVSQSPYLSLTTSDRKKHTAQVLLATANVNIADSEGNKIECRAILDSCSQVNFITHSLAKKLNLKNVNVQIPLAGVNESLSNISRQIETTIFSLDNRYKAKETFLVVNKITDDLPQIPFDVSKLQLPSDIHLADENLNEPGPIDLLLGANIFFNTLCVGQIKLGKNSPVLQKTRLGWILSGSLSLENNSRPVFCNLVVSNNDLHDQVKQFWALEEINTEPSRTREECECEEYFMQTFKREDDGRFEVSLPFKDNVTDLGDSRDTAIKRFQLLEKRLQRDDKFKTQYVQFMREYQALGHMSEIIETENNEKIKYYLPHHGVVKEGSKTTKLRVVFDASCKSTSGLSLNDVLKIGPTIQRDLFAIAIKMRQHNVVFIGDIEKMYRQINVNKQHRDCQRVVWRENPDSELKHFQLNTITYGTASASFLACRVLYQVAIENEEKYPKACEIIKRDFYMDDLITGAENVEQALILKSEITKILNAAKLPLRKWCSNRQELLENENDNNVTQYCMSRDETIKALGLVWEPNKDILSYTVNISTCKTITKRYILSTISKIFDPLGLIGPTTVQAKVLLQKLWQANIAWDESVPIHLHTLWRQFCESLHDLNAIKIPRQVTIPEYSEIEIHGFSDSSEIAFGACIYIRTKDYNGNYFVKLLCAKSKVAPLKKVTLPRLELNAALLLVRLMNKAENSLGINFSKKYLWCDSTIVLSWLNAESNTWNTYVANRVSEIQEFSKNSEWRHVPSALNPADIISRGCNPTKLSNNDLWWSGPEFLKNETSCWPNLKLVASQDLPEKRKVIQLSFLTYNLDFFFEKYSSFIKMHRVFTYVLRFLHNVNQHNKAKLTGDITIDELDRSLVLLLKMVQYKSFIEEMKCLQSNKEIPKSSKLLSLNIFIDENGLIRVGGRIKQSNEHFDKKHQIVLPFKHPLTKMIIVWEHKRMLHAGQQAVLAAIRQKYWPINGKRAVRDVLRKCIVCFRTKPSNFTPLMGNIPKSRLSPARPFSTVGIDYAGPILVKDGTLKSRKLVKAYICIFVCFATKAVHIELAGDLSTKTFLNCLKRFISRRGFCKDIYSDNGTNFVGANNELKSIVKNLRESIKTGETRDFLLQHLITWHFNPPFSPHLGGLWEAAVKSAKMNLIRVVGNAHLTYEGLYTVICQIEAVLNSRPLIPLSHDPEDLSVLTPAHFLVGDSLIALPQRDVTTIPANRLKLYEHLQQIVQHFWGRWSSEYLTSLQQRTKWKRKYPDLQEGDLVLIKDDNQPTLCWKLGRVTTLHSGSDGITRVVSVLTNSGEVKRSVVRLCKLPLDE